MTKHVLSSLAISLLVLTSFQHPVEGWLFAMEKGCDGQPYDIILWTCCEGILWKEDSADIKHRSCCGFRAYDPQHFLCCGRALISLQYRDKC